MRVAECEGYYVGVTTATWGKLGNGNMGIVVGLPYMIHRGISVGLPAYIIGAIGSPSKQGESGLPAQMIVDVGSFSKHGHAVYLSAHIIIIMASPSKGASPWGF